MKKLLLSVAMVAMIGSAALAQEVKKDTSSTKDSSTQKTDTSAQKTDTTSYASAKQLK